MRKLFKICRNKRGKPMIIDPGLDSLNKSNIWWVIKQRTLPTAFKLYTGRYPPYLSFSFYLKSVFASPT